MAINIDSVYKSVLVVLEQQKRGILTPTEFNKIATTCQQEIFTEYFDELNQLLRAPQTSLAYADRMALLDEKISLFKTAKTLTLGDNTITPAAGLSTVTVPSDVQELGSVIFGTGITTPSREAQRIQQYEIYTTNQSPLTAPSAYYPVYTYENKLITIYPKETSANSGKVVLNYLKFPTDVRWGFTINPELGNYIYNSLDSIDFDLHQSDGPLLISKILGYAGVMTKDQAVMTLGSQKEQSININSKQ